LTVYLDTSVLLPSFVTEATSPVVQRWFSEHASEEWVTSLWTSVEFASAIGNRIRGGTLSFGEGEVALAAFDREIAGKAELAEPQADDFVFARRAVAKFNLGLRGGDALHVAIALRLEAPLLLTLDRRLANAARAFGLDAAEPA
jgi:predicted nucleic acid-binding protein